MSQKPRIRKHVPRRYRRRTPPRLHLSVAGRGPILKTSTELDLFQAILDLIPLGIYWKDRNLVYLGCNRAFAADAGVADPADIIGKTDRDLPWTPEQTAVFRRSDREVLEHQSHYHMLEEVKIAGDQVIWTETNKIPIYDANGSIVGVLGIYQDVTMQRHEQETLRESQQRLQLIMDNIPQAIFWKDRNSYYQGCNCNFAAAAGIASTQEIAGKTDFDLAWTQDEAENFRTIDRQVMESGKEILHITERLRTAQGVRAWVDTNKIPLHDAQGSVVGILGTYEDITERKQTEEALEHARAELEARVELRTTELSQANQLLQQEVLERKALESIEREQRTLAEALRDTAAVLNSTLDLNEVLDRILQVIGRVVQHDAATIVMIEKGDGRVVRYAHMNGDVYDRAIVGRLYPMEKLNLMRRMVTTRQPLIVENIPNERLEIASADFPWVQSFLGCPILSGGEVLGFINLNSATPLFFKPLHAERLLAFANQAATAIQNARLYEQAQALAALEERQRLARDLHDSVNQTLWTLTLLADVFPTTWEENQEEGRHVLERFKRLTRGALAEMRTLLLELRPAYFNQSRLDELIRQLVEAMTSRKKIDVSFAVCGDVFSLPAEVQIGFYRITQEALNNLTKHSRASEAQVFLEFAHGLVSVEIWDNGRGFDVISTAPEHMGLEIMRERANAIGARLEISSALGEGTYIRAVWQNTANG